ncbi:hypothetical protein DCC85_16275 [Paenibacillus sp. CAA11]|uniref:histidine phosphatase family protein n=1 Tax=Paenibacillus sp. CAA11 TaxID=1532905 RepID=UPI000D3826C2|nr:histidine phosphatase family protein [Paenibacillus sp. CAA11]AWB45595.1 hypothetical protein DCC85_16275 [Paenibacillus sp. CAA11]
MNTMLYFVRHAESEYIEGQERMRGLTEQGGRDALQVAALLADERIDRFISSPYERAVQTLEPLAERGSKRIELYEDLRKLVRLTRLWECGSGRA